MAKLPLIDKEFWFNTEPTIVHSLTNRVILIHFWDYTNSDCIRTCSSIKAWHERYADKGLVVIGVHTPEFTFGKERDTIAHAVHELGLTYPIVMDNDYTIWNYLSNRHWPAIYIIDKQGMLRYEHCGEGNYKETEIMIQKLLREVDASVELPEIMKQVHDTDISGEVSYTITPKIYMGNERMAIGNEEACSGTGTFEFLDPKIYKEDVCYLDGTWWIGPEHIRLASRNWEPGSIIVNYVAAEVNVVIAPERDVGFKVYVEQDGQPLPSECKGNDVKIDYEKRAYTVIERPQLYNIIVNRNVDRHIVKLTATSNSCAVYVFTFGSSSTAHPKKKFL
jgi:thiol-disulfide isomerase/thioredoxin